MAQPIHPAGALIGAPARGENLALGIGAGVIAALVGAGVWMGIGLATHMHLGLVAIGVGALVGFAVRVAGNGTTIVYGIVGAVLTLLGCVTGEVLAALATAAGPVSTDDGQAGSSSFGDLLVHTHDYVQLLTFLFTNMSPMGYIIYGIGIYEGFKLSIRKTPRTA